jgi:hypothetical protein
MDVRNRARSGRVILFAACLHLLMGATALADPIYTIIDLGTSPTSGVDSSGNGTVTGSNGLTYTFNPVQNYLPAQWNNTTQGVPIVYPAPVGLPTANDIPGQNFAFSYSNLNYMNSQGLAAGINTWGVYGDQSNGVVFLTQQQANGSWGAPIPIWSAGSSIQGMGTGTIFAGIMGISPNGQVLGCGGVMNQWGTYNPILYLYDTKTQALTNLTSLISSITLTSSPQLPPGGDPNWYVNFPYYHCQLDNQGRILVQADPPGLLLPGYSADTLLLIPQGVSADPIAVPEPESWAVFATLIGGWIAHKRLRSRTRFWT